MKTFLYCYYCRHKIDKNLLTHWNTNHPGQLMKLIAETLKETK